MERLTQCRDVGSGVHPFVPQPATLPDSMIACIGLLLLRWVVGVPLVLIKCTLSIPIFGLFWLLSAVVGSGVVRAVLGGRLQWFALRFVSFWLGRSLLLLLGVWRVHHELLDADSASMSAMGHHVTSSHIRGRISASGVRVEPIYVAPWATVLDVLYLSHRHAPVFAVPVSCFAGVSSRSLSKNGVGEPPQFPDAPVDRVRVYNTAPELMLAMLKSRVGFRPLRDDDDDGDDVRFVSLADAAPLGRPIVLFVEGCPSNGNGILWTAPVLPPTGDACRKYLDESVGGRPLAAIAVDVAWRLSSPVFDPAVSSLWFFIRLLNQLTVRLTVREAHSDAMDLVLSQRNSLSLTTTRVGGVLGRALKVVSGHKPTLFMAACDYRSCLALYLQYTDKKTKGD